MMNSRLFWPATRPHRILTTELRAESVPEVVQDLLGDVLQLAELADTILSLEATGHRDAHTNPAAREARMEAAALLERTAERLPGPESEVLGIRAEGLNGGDPALAARRQAEIEERDLILLYGPTSTWRRKSTGTFFGGMASVPNARWNALVNRADAHLDAIVGHLAQTLSQPDLVARPVPGFRIADLLCIGGEPDGFPKHFAYFLPEDEGVPGVTPAKTVVYANVYAAHHALISRPLAERLFRAPGRDWPGEPLELLLLWFRGHDLGHQLRLPQTRLRDLHAVGRETSIALQEALADVIGYLAVVGGPWRAEFGYERDVAGSTFLAELLRYLERGPGLFPDSDAAFFELDYLVANGHVEISASDGRVSWDPDRLHDGVLELAKALTEALLDTDVARTEALVGAHFPHERAPLVRWLQSRSALTSDVPTTFAYHFEEMAR